MAKDPSFPFYASDWLGSTKIALMSAEQERGYLRLLCHMWNAPGCCLPNDDDALARLSLMGEGWFNGGSRLVRECFIVHPENSECITHEKLLALKREREEWRRKSAEGGAKSAYSRQVKSQSKGGYNGGTNGGSTTLGREHPTKRQPNANSPSPSPSSNTGLAGACADGPEPVNSGKAPSIFAGVTVEVLRDSAELQGWYERASRKRLPVIRASEQNRLFVFSAAERALDKTVSKPADNPAALFAWIISNEKREFITQDHEERARRRLLELDGRGLSIAKQALDCLESPG